MRLPFALRRVLLLPAACALLAAGCGGGGSGAASDQTMSLSAVAQGTSEVALAWTAPPTAVTGYSVLRDGAPVFPTIFNGTAVTDNDLAPGTTYCYQVIAVAFPIGRVASSNVACATTGLTAGWPLAVIAATTVSGSYTALALDSSGHAHVVFRGATGVGYATNSPAGTWSSETLDGAAGSIGGTAIALDGSAKAHVSYYDAVNARLMYATNASGTWAAEPVATSAGFVSSIAVDGLGNIAIAYADEGELRYTARSGATWSVAAFIAGFSNNIAAVSLATDSLGLARIAYAVGNGVCAVRYAARLDASTWTDEPVDASARCGASLALDGTDVAHVAYVDGQELRVADKSSGNWVAATADRMSWIGGNQVSIAADAGGRLHVSYQDNNADLKYATNGSGAWLASVIDASGSVGAYNALRVEASGRVHIAYHDATNLSVKYARSP
jgi:hypothetical protein